jgi:hypothetical protein
MRWRVWTMVASSVRVVVSTWATDLKKFRIETAFVVSSAPWSMTLRTSCSPMMAAVTCTPPVPQPRGIGTSRLANGTWKPGIATAFSRARRIIRLVCSSR